MIEALQAALGADAVLTGVDCAAWSRDWTGVYEWTPLCVVRPASTQQVSAVLALAHAQGVPVVPVSGHTGLAGGTHAQGAVMLSLDRMKAVREVRAQARLAVVEAGVILSDLHDAVAEQGLSFPMTFGARGSARMGGLLATNAGGSNVLRHGNTRDLVLGLEAVLADGRIVDLMSELHKNNTGYDLRHLLIGSEGTLGVITAAVVKLVPQPLARATAMVGMADLNGALSLLNRLQDVSGGAVEAFEYMPARYMRAYHETHPGTQPVLENAHPVQLLVELAATAPRDVTPDADGDTPLTAYLQEVLMGLMEEGAIDDAVVAQTGAQRDAMWHIRECAAELSMVHRRVIVADVAVPLDKVARFLALADARVGAADPGFDTMVVSHLGDGNIHYTVWPTADADVTALTELIEDVVLELGGSFSAEHGIGLTKLGSMRRRKDAVALDMMRAIKAALDPKNILNPGKTLPPV